MKRRRSVLAVCTAFAPHALRYVTAAGGLILAACASNPSAPVVDLSENAESAAAATAATAVRSAPAPGTYRVVRGDTLYAIAFRRGLDYRDVAAWNRIPPPYRIYAGQDLRLDGAPSNAHQAAAATSTVAAATTSTAAATTSAAATPKPAPDKPGMFEDVSSAPPAVPPAPNPAPVVAAQTNAETVTAKPPPLPSPKPVAPEPAAKPVVAEAPPPLHVGEDSVASSNGVAWRWPGRGSLIGTFVGGDQTRQGIDIAGKAGDPVLAAADGEVVYSGNGLLGYGELIIVKHNANFLSAYGHNRKRLVQEGDEVKGGQQIAEMGSSASARDELHFEIRKNGKPVNPIDYLPAR
jgi:lipoprotein NlpD